MVTSTVVPVSGAPVVVPAFWVVSIVGATVVPVLPAVVPSGTTVLVIAVTVLVVPATDGSVCPTVDGGAVEGAAVVVGSVRLRKI